MSSSTPHPKRSSSNYTNAPKNHLVSRNQINAKYAKNADRK